MMGTLQTPPDTEDHIVAKDDESSREFLKRAREMEEQAARQRKLNAEKVKREAREFLEKLQEEGEEAASGKEIEDFVQNKFGVSHDDLMKEFKVAEDDAVKGDIQDYLAAVRRGKNAKAKRITQRKGFRKGVASARKKKGWCSLILLGLIGGVGAIVYTAYEGISAIASALF
jgi:hypothetical protein